MTSCSACLLQRQRIKEALLDHMIYAPFLHPGKETTDKALAQAAGRPVLELVADSKSYVSFSHRVSAARNTLQTSEAEKPGKPPWPNESLADSLAQ